MADPPILLDAGSSPPIGVASPSRLTVFVGDAPRQLLLFSGVAVPEFRGGKHLAHQEVVIRLGATTTQQFSWTATAGLAVISNDDSDFIFALDTTTVDTDQDGTLRLRVAIGAMGNPSDLLRFCYNVQVLSDPVQSTVTGQISWHSSFGIPTFAVLQAGAPMFQVLVGETVNVPKPAGQFPQTTFVQACPAGFSSLPVAAGDLWVAAYEVRDVPLGSQWEVRPALLAGTLTGPPAGYVGEPHFDPLPQSAFLTANAPSAAAVDFTMTFDRAQHIA